MRRNENKLDKYSKKEKWDKRRKASHEKCGRIAVEKKSWQLKEKM